MKMLILATDYPSQENKIILMYIHTRNLYYKKNGIDVTVLNFSTKERYEMDGIPVITLADYEHGEESYDILVSHAPNIRMHYTFLKKYNEKFPKVVFFFHGHEVLYRSKTYSRPYDYVKSNYLKGWLEDRYDSFKLKIWHRYLKKLASKSYFVFVSNWMLDEFKRWVKLTEKDLKNHIMITYNSIGENFENLHYDREKKKDYNFITIRGNLDGSKYAVDNVCRLAEKFPQYQFLLIGKGRFFEYNNKPANVVWKEEYCNHQQIVLYLNQAECALMPTRTDAQGVMACEMATFGIPLITSEMPVCHEIFDEFENVRFISNEQPEKDFIEAYKLLKTWHGDETNHMYYAGETVKREIELFRKLEAELIG